MGLQKIYTVQNILQTIYNNNIYNKTVERSEFSLSDRGERVIILSDGLWEERFPVSVFTTAKLEQTFGEGALLSDQCELERVERIFHDG